MACSILTYFQVMPSYIDYMTVFAIKFGEQVDASDLRFSGFKERLLLSPVATGTRSLSLPQLGLSGRSFQICFNLKSVSLKKAVGVRERWQWSPRQAVFHHQFDAGHGTSLWIMTSARDDIQNRIQELTGENGDEEDRSFETPARSFISSLAVHSVLAQWASEDWRGYIRWLEQVLEEKTIDALRSGTFVPSSEDISFVQKKEDETNRVIMMLRANGGILESITTFYQELMQNHDFPLRNDPDCQRAIADFMVELRDYMHDFQLHVDRAQTLGKITADRKNLVQQHLQAHATAKMEAMTSQAQQEAVTMRIIAVVTLIYLPATFVSTLFSTDIVKYQNVEGDESYSSLALQRWFSITIPLTLITFAMAAGWLARDKIMAFFRKPRRSTNFDLEKLD
ncbi:hypothetical protein CONLIGDRAFT_652875 [Coniochaeta ligniaria NRRL 30616]|uniref:CorA-like transporter domain-containing protein n=1 Tax=Coniochaeta ligniaria NRRL 30616 TaxID=1408157 RepID=A0A1J7IWE8_9PEZI|nr:hypothetical protein CONLIGDRAFT_652875 [Coniochaeta ligniaria NRRL 30616]